ncbi:hypothetical protein ACS0TY_030614 [Phlomoides rotata]
MKIFQGCLGAFNGTLIYVIVPEINKARYHTRKGIVSVNFLVACDQRMYFIYMLIGWEGSIGDAHVLDNGLRVLHGKRNILLQLCLYMLKIRQQCLTSMCLIFF